MTAATRASSQFATASAGVAIGEDFYARCKTGKHKAGSRALTATLLRHRRDEDVTLDLEPVGPRGGYEIVRVRLTEKGAARRDAYFAWRAECEAKAIARAEMVIARHASGERRGHGRRKRKK